MHFILRTYYCTVVAARSSVHFVFTTWNLVHWKSRAACICVTVARQLAPPFPFPAPPSVRPLHLAAAPITTVRVSRLSSSWGALPCAFVVFVRVCVYMCVSAPCSASGTGSAGAHSGTGAARGEGSVANVAAYGGLGRDDDRELHALVRVAGVAAGFGRHARERGRGVGRRGAKRSAQGECMCVCVCLCMYERACFCFVQVV